MISLILPNSYPFWRASSRAARIVQTDGGGLFELPLEGGQYLVYAYKACYVTQARVLVLPPEGEDSLDFELAPFDYDGAPCMDSAR